MNIASLNQAQIQLLETFAGIQSKEEIDELTKVIRNYYAEKLEKEMQRLWDNNILDDAKLCQLRKEHLRSKSLK